jgi:hypothetical protein
VVFSFLARHFAIGVKMLYSDADEALGSERHKKSCNLLRGGLDTANRDGETTQMKSRQLGCSRIKTWNLRNVNLAREPGALMEAD